MPDFAPTIYRDSRLGHNSFVPKFVPTYLEMDRFFFHSFPRLRQGEKQHTQIKKGQLIAASLVDNGIMLSPETYEIPLLDGAGDVVDRLRTTQRRACFTELELEGLPGHSETFGPFALVYRIDDLRQVGALPVFYVPLIQALRTLAR